MYLFVTQYLRRMYECNSTYFHLDINQDLCTPMGYSDVFIYTLFWGLQFFKTLFGVLDTPDSFFFFGGGGGGG